jgi:hypothetical protein
MLHTPPLHLGEHPYSPFIVIDPRRYDVWFMPHSQMVLIFWLAFLFKYILFPHLIFEVLFVTVIFEVSAYYTLN